MPYVLKGNKLFAIPERGNGVGGGGRGMWTRADQS